MRPGVARDVSNGGRNLTVESDVAAVVVPSGVVLLEAESRLAEMTFPARRTASPRVVKSSPTSWEVKRGLLAVSGQSYRPHAFLIQFFDTGGTNRLKTGCVDVARVLTRVDASSKRGCDGRNPQKVGELLRRR